MDYILIGYMNSSLKNNIKPNQFILVGLFFVPKKEASYLCRVEPSLRYQLSRVASSHEPKINISYKLSRAATDKYLVRYVHPP